MLVSNSLMQHFLSRQWCVNHCDVRVCTVCDCDEEGSVSPHCSDDGVCQCKPGASGRRCDSCLPGYTWRGNGSGCTGELAVSTTVIVLMKTHEFMLNDLVLSEKTCDDDTLICRNGGTCINFQRCICPDSFTGTCTAK